MNRLESTILKNLLYNEEYTRKVVPFIQKSYFSENSEKLLFQEIFDFIEKYKTLPTYESLVINFTEKKTVTETEVQSVVEI